jgi:hypothetical protein
MRITKQRLRWIIKEELSRFQEAPEEKEGEAPEAKNKIIKGLALIGIDEGKLKELPSNEQQLKAFMDMINKAIDTTIAGKAVAAEKKVSAGTKGME